MKKAFILCGLTGWCMEILWTGLHSILSGELTMTGKTSLLMFPIYGCGAIIRPLGSLTVGYQKKVPAGRIKPAFFVSNFWFLSIVFYCNVL